MDNFYHSNLTISNKEIKNSRPNSANEFSYKQNNNTSPTLAKNITNQDSKNPKTDSTKD